MIGEIVLGRVPPPEHCTESRLKHGFSLSAKEAYLLVLELQPEGTGFRFLPHLEIMKCSQRTYAKRCHHCAFPLPHHSPPMSPSQSLTNPPGVPIFATTTQHTTLDHLALVDRGLMLVIP